MQHSLANEFFRLLYKLFGYQRPLPPEETVATFLKSLSPQRSTRDNEFAAEILKKGPQPCCMFTFYEGGCVCAEGISDCDAWGDYWRDTQHRPGVAQRCEKCPGSCKVYKR